MRLSWRLGDLDTWRERVERELGALRKDLDSVTKADEIADAVRSAVREERKLRLTLPQSIGALLTGALLVADAVKGLIS